MELFEQQYFTEQYIILTRTEEGHEKDLSTINYKTPAHPCNVVFNLKSPLGDTKPSNFRPIFFVLR